jgi:hypothetical protein
VKIRLLGCDGRSGSPLVLHIKKIEFLHSALEFDSLAEFAEQAYEST